MKRFLITLILMLVMLPAVWAQEELAIGAFFDKKYTRRTGAKEVMVKNHKVGERKMTLFRSLNVPLTDEESRLAEQLVQQDGAQALDRELATKGGRTCYAFFRLPDAKNGIHRYIFYRNQALFAGNKPITNIIYIEGTVTMADLRRRFGK